MQANSQNKLLGVRGQAGTHDIKLAHNTLQQLKSANSDSSEIALVRYDKSSHSGRGNRASEGAWQQVKGKVDVVLFEGWMLGFRPLLDQAAQKVRHINTLLAFDYTAMQSFDLAGPSRFGILPPHFRLH